MASAMAWRLLAGQATAAACCEFGGLFQIAERSLLVRIAWARRKLTNSHPPETLPPWSFGPLALM